MKRIAVYSGTGGVGKSFIAANLASSLFQRGVRVALCELSTHNLMSMHFGGSLATSDLGEQDKGSIRAKRNIPPLHDDQQFHSHVLHADFTLLAACSGSEQAFDERLMSALQFADRMHGIGGIMIFDLPTNMRPIRNDSIFDIELEIVAAEPVSIAASCRHDRATNELEDFSSLAREHYVVINKKDLRSDLSRDAAVVAEALFGETVISCIHYDSAVPEAFAHKSLLNDYAPHSQAAMDISELSRTIAGVLKLDSNAEKDSA